MDRQQILDWIAEGLERWPEAAERHRMVAACGPRVLARYEGFEWKALLLPARKVSTLARLDAGSVAARPCFLCAANRPQQQAAMPWRGYEILVNPFPVFPNHLTIAATDHTPQRIPGRIADMAALAGELEGFTVIYNGARSGASAPDHFHFQAVPSGYIDMLRFDRGPVYSRRFIGRDADTVVRDVEQYLLSAGLSDDGAEMSVNIAMERLDDGNLLVRVVPRRAHRPSCYPTPAVSPGAIDIFGTIVTVSDDDFMALDRDCLERILAEVAYPNPDRCIRVGIMSSRNPEFTLNGRYERVADTFFPLDDDASFTLEDVPVGSQFHWEHTERRTYPGTLELQRRSDGTVEAVNVIGMERYLEGVIGAEMSPESPDELLKAHAVISRSWAYKQIACREALHYPAQCGCGLKEAGDEHIRWYDHDDHTDFDVCADDHCQRYLGLPAEEYSVKLHEIIRATSGEVVLDGDVSLCDTRFSKCCGGAFEEFEYCWEPVHHSCLEAARDTVPSHPVSDLRDEEEAVRWIMSAPEAFCASPDAAVLRSVLNRSDFDTTPDFYRWTVTYTPDELSDIVRERSGIDFGMITGLQPIERGKSGRIVRLRITGTLRTMTVGKELEIRRWLSRSHLYSSAFVVERGDEGEFILHGAGWGHGVGLCQIGAAVMASEGYDYRTILRHYFNNADIRACLIINVAGRVV